MKTFLLAAAFVLGLMDLAVAELAVTQIKVTHRSGQTFVTWKDVADAQAGAEYRYSVFRSPKPITADNLATAEVCMVGVLHNSALLFGHGFWPADRVNPEKPMSVIQAGGEPLPRHSGLAVVNPPEPAASFYAVVATDLEGQPVTKIVPGQSATTVPVSEKPGPLSPIKIHDSKERATYVKQTQISGKQGLPLYVKLHASNGRGGGASNWGDYYLYFSRRDWGYRDGLPGVFSVLQRDHGTPGERLHLESRDAIVHPSGQKAMETYWFGYACVPPGAEHTEPRAYPFTERRMLWTIDWVKQQYGVDPQRVYCSGGSMGAWGTSTFALRHPEIFAAVYPNRPRTRQRGLPSLPRQTDIEQVLMEDGRTRYLDRMNMVEFVRNHPEDLPFIGWCCGRHDGFASFKEQIALVQALTEAKHGFAFAWNDGNHGTGAKAMQEVERYYPATLFARNQSYPALGNSSLNDDPGTGEVERLIDNRKRPVLDENNGALTGGINLGFEWKNVVDEPNRWSVALSNVLAKDAITVDVTPRRCQQFKPSAGAVFTWRSSLGEQGKVTADAHGLVTIAQFKIQPGQPVELTIEK